MGAFETLDVDETTARLYVAGDCGRVRPASSSYTRGGA